MHRLILTALILLPILTSCRGSGGDDSPTLSTNACGVVGLNSKVVNGTRCDDSNSPIVAIQIEGPSGASICSGSLLTSRHILTAAHCFIGEDYTRVLALVGGRAAGVSRVTLHPAARAVGSGVQNDLAIVTLSAPTAVQTLPISVTSSAREDQALSVYGYGLDEANNVGTLRSGQTLVESVDSNFITTIYDGEGSDPCFGDSGSPGVIIVRTESGERPAVVGVLSAGSNSTCTPTDRNLYVNVQSYIDFITLAAPGTQFL